MKEFQKKHPHIVDSRINLLSDADNQYPRGKKIFRVSRFILYLFIILIIAFFVFSYQVLFTDNSITQVFGGKIGIFKQLNILAGSGNRLQGESDDRINILLLGMGGAGHDGPYLTDTLIFASIQPSTKKVSLVSLPRDLLVEIPGYGWWKINNANAFGEQKNSGQGGLLVKEVVQGVFNLPVHYYLRIDFSGFEKMIDELGGFKINVEKSFNDFQYPTEDYKYQVVSFESGQQTMDGETALKFVRSRHGNNGEGSDFARSKRQQKVLQAVKQRVFSYRFLLSPRKISKLIKQLADHLRTDFEPWELVKLAKLLEKIDTSKIENVVLDDSPQGMLYAGIVNDAYVLQPRGDDFSQIQYLVKNIFKSTDNNNEQIIEKSITTVEIRNGTTISGLASRNSQELKLLGYRVLKIGNAPEQDFTTTKIYQLSNNQLTEEVGFLEKKYHTTVETNNIPDWISQTASLDIDFMIVLGQDSDSTQ